MARVSSQEETNRGGHTQGCASTCRRGCGTNSHAFSCSGCFPQRSRITTVTHPYNDTTWWTQPHITPAGLVEALHKAYKQFAWEAQPRGPGLTVFNAFTNEMVQVYYVVIRTIEDSVGLTKPVCCHSQPAYIGVSNQYFNYKLTMHSCFDAFIILWFIQYYRCYQTIAPIV